MITHVHIMQILRVHRSLSPIISVLHIMVRSKLAQEKKKVRCKTGMQVTYITT